MPHRSEHRPAQKHCRPQGGWLAVRGRWAGLMLIKAQQIEAKEHGQEGRFGGKERLQTKAIGSQFVLQLFNALLDSGSAIIIAPQLQGLLSAVGDPEAK